MSLSFATILLLAQGPSSQEPLPPFLTPKVLFWEAAEATGFWICSGPDKRRQAREFNKRFGERVRRLVTAMEVAEGRGWNGNEDFILTCKRWVNPRDAKKSRIRTLNEFEPRLNALEAKYLPGG